MFSSIECAAAWAQGIIDAPVYTYVPDDAQDHSAFALVERTGGSLDYPHDSPDITLQVWTKDEATAEQLANWLAIAAKTRPIEDPHVNSMGVPEMMSYGKAKGSWFIWQISVVLNVNLLD